MPYVCTVRGGCAHNDADGSFFDDLTDAFGTREGTEWKPKEVYCEVRTGIRYIRTKHVILW